MAKWGRVGFVDLERLAKSFQHVVDTKTIESFIEDFLMEMAMRALRKIKKRTPEGQGTPIPGNLRRNWKVGEVIKNGDSYEIVIYNATEYAPYVEFGHRQEVGRYVPAIGKRLVNPWVEGRFMMTISMKEIEREFPKYLEKRMNEMLNNLLKGRL